MGIKAVPAINISAFILPAPRNSLRVTKLAPAILKKLVMFRATKLKSDISEIQP
jgi:hypothetical protein